MKIGVISDTHVSIKGWEMAWQVLRDTDCIIHCGDLFNYGSGNPLPEGYSPKELLDKFNNLDKPLLVVRGNCDSEVDQKFLDVPAAYPFLVYQIDALKIIATHGHYFSDEQWLNTCGRKWKSGILLSGHTHRWKLENKYGIFLMNPGSTSLPAGEPSAALIDMDDKKLLVFNLNTMDILKSEILL